MSDPKRILDGAGDFERALLGAASDDRPSDTSRKAAALALGITAVPPPAFPTSGAGGASAAGASALPAAGQVAAIASQTVWPLGTKILLGALIAASATGVTVVATRTPQQAPPAIERRAPAPPPPSLPAIPSLPAPVVIDTPPPAPIEEKVMPRVKLTPPPRARAPEVFAPKEPEAVPAEAAPESTEPVNGAPARISLERETELIGGAEAAIVAGRLDEASALLTRYAFEGVGGVLAPEAEALSIDLALKRGNHGAARLLAQAFIAAHPKSPLAPRYRALAAEGAP